MSDPTITIEEITPQRAAEILEKNSSNRNLRKTRVDAYARDMAAGKWSVNGDPIRFNGNGKLFDGQHRLTACLLANKPFKTAVARGLTDASHATIDTGLGRTIADELKWRGEENAAPLGAILGLVWQYDNGAQWAIPPSRFDLITLLSKQPKIRDSLFAMSVGKKTGVRGTALAATHYLASKEHSAEAATTFVQDLAAGVDYTEGDPCLALRNYAASMNSVRMHRPTTVEWFAVCIKAANYWLLGRPISSLRWRRVGSKKERFPQIVGADEVGGDE